MENKHQVHNLIILDESGSMNSIKPLIINGFNSLVKSINEVEEQFPEQEHLISMVTFNSFSNKLQHFLEPVFKLNPLNNENYSPSSATPLFDAMGFSITKLKQHLEGKTDYNVLVTILTDGAENCSKEYTGNAIKAMVDELKDLNWTFTYIGADHDVEEMASRMSINNTMSFNKDTAGIENMFTKERNSRFSYSKKIRAKENTCYAFYDEDTTVNNVDDKDVVVAAKSNPEEKKPTSLWDKYFKKK